MPHCRQDSFAEMASLIGETRRYTFQEVVLPLDACRVAVGVQSWGDDAIKGCARVVALAMRIDMRASKATETFVMDGRALCARALA